MYTGQFLQELISKPRGEYRFTIKQGKKELIGSVETRDFNKTVQGRASMSTGVNLAWQAITNLDDPITYEARSLGIDINKQKLTYHGVNEASGDNPQPETQPPVEETQVVEEQTEAEVVEEPSSEEDTKPREETSAEESQDNSEKAS